MLHYPPFLHRSSMLLDIYNLILNWKSAYTSLSVLSPSFLNPLSVWGPEEHTVSLPFWCHRQAAGTGHGKWLGAAGIRAASHLAASPIPHLGHRLRRCRRKSSLRAFLLFPWELGKCRINNNNNYSSWKILFLLASFLAQRESCLELHKVFVIEENSFSTE